MDLCHWGPQTGEPEVNSYLDEGTVGLGGSCPSPIVGSLRTNVVPLIDADVRDDLIGVAGVVSGRAVGVTHGDHAAEIGDAMRISIGPIKYRSNAWKELIEKELIDESNGRDNICLLYTSPSPRD